MDYKRTQTKVLNLLSLLFLSFFLLNILSCQTAQIAIVTEEIPSTKPPVNTIPPTPRPTTLLEPADDFVPGQCPVPQDQYLFLRYSSHASCSSACDCPVVEPPRPAIDRDGEDIISSTTTIK